MIRDGDQVRTQADTRNYAVRRGLYGYHSAGRHLD
jgi:hypothetical protein